MMHVRLVAALTFSTVLVQITDNIPSRKSGTDRVHSWTENYILVDRQGRKEKGEEADKVIMRRYWK